MTENDKLALLIIEAVREGHPVDKVAADFAVSKGRVRSVMAAFGIRPKDVERAKITKRILDLFESGVSVEGIAEEIGRSTAHCRQVIVAHLGTSRRKLAPRNDEKVERNDAIREEYQAGATSIALGEKYGVSRERVCQLLRPMNLIANKHERARLAREVLKEEKEAMRAELCRERDERVAKVAALVKDGMSINKAIQQVGFIRGIWNHPALRGMSKHGRHRDFADRARRFIELRKEGKTIGEVLRIMRAEGDNITPSWTYRYIPEEYLGRRGHHVRKLKLADDDFALTEWAGHSAVPIIRTL